MTPKFQSINNGNWSNLEYSIQGIVRNNPSYRITIYTGTFGVLTVDRIPLYLAPGATNRIPIPKAFYKIIQIDATAEAMVFVGVNNPYASRAEIEDRRNGYLICADICSRRDILQKGVHPCSDKDQMSGDRVREAQYISSGYIYMCEIGDFVKGLKMIYGIDLSPELMPETLKKSSTLRTTKQPSNPLSAFNQALQMLLKWQG